MKAYWGILWHEFVGYRASQRVAFPTKKAKNRRIAKVSNLVRKRVFAEDKRSRVKIPRSVKDKLKRGRKGNVIRGSVSDHSLLQ
jgi:hypothetical protein